MKKRRKEGEKTEEEEEIRGKQCMHGCPFKMYMEQFFLFSNCSDERVLKESSRKSQLGPGKKRNIFGLEIERKKPSSLFNDANCLLSYFLFISSNSSILLFMEREQ